MNGEQNIRGFMMKKHTKNYMMLIMLSTGFIMAVLDTTGVALAAVDFVGMSTRGWGQARVRAAPIAPQWVQLHDECHPGT